MTVYSMYVPGEPATAGSKTSFRHNVTGKVVTIDSCKRKPVWSSIVQQTAVTQGRVPSPVAGPIMVNVVFLMPRPGYHYGADGKIKNAYQHTAHTKRPDATKLWRCAEDALKNFWWIDDSQIYKQMIIKRYTQQGETPGMLIEMVAE